MFTEQDLKQIHDHGLTEREVMEQLERFSTGFPYLNIVRAATVGDGIFRMDSQLVDQCARVYREMKSWKNIVKFVPASGAATRMFKELFAYADQGKGSPAAEEAAAEIDRFAFGAEVRRILKGNDDPRAIVSAIIHKDGLGYGSLPKALILFHKYPEGSRTALEEHLVEGAMYAIGWGNDVNVHFTVSPEHREHFEKRIDEVKAIYESRYGVTYNISYSQQKAQTDTIAVTPGNEPFRETDGSLLFRPAGHGALLENLGEIDADLIFVKNIDNVTTDARRADTVRYKQALAGILLILQQKCFTALERLENTKNPDAALLEETARFVEEELAFRFPEGFGVWPDERRYEYLRGILNRPIRVCGMVKNEGEPGGGPFWAVNKDGSQSLQIAESSQIAPERKGLMASATHFNPVDLVCGTKDYRGRTFDLKKFADPETGFISSKSKEGRELKALELPGLWNGSMSAWNTVFIEVPISTFTPVKAVNDLLQPEHCNE